MFFSWFNAEESREFGTSLAKLFVERIPANQKYGDTEFSIKTQKLLAKASLQVVAFKSKNELNIYKKAQLGNAFKWTLSEAGFDQGYSEKLTKWLMMQLG